MEDLYDVDKRKSLGVSLEQMAIILTETGVLEEGFYLWSESMMTDVDLIHYVVSLAESQISPEEAVMWMGGYLTTNQDIEPTIDEVKVDIQKWIKNGKSKLNASIKE